MVLRTSLYTEDHCGCSHYNFRDIQNSSQLNKVLVHYHYRCVSQWCSESSFWRHWSRGCDQTNPGWTRCFWSMLWFFYSCVGSLITPWVCFFQLLVFLVFPVCPGGSHCSALFCLLFINKLILYLGTVFKSYVTVKKVLIIWQFI